MNFLEQDNQRGAIVLSLDFELHWGVFDCIELSTYQKNLYGARVAIPKMLDLFNQYEMHATWAIVGLLFCDGRDEAEAFAPRVRPAYQNRQRSAYRLFSSLGSSEKKDPLHFAPSLIAQIKTCPFQEIATHTFSHFYCNEPGSRLEVFEEDLYAACQVAKEKGITFRSIVFPRNQYNEGHLRICSDLGIKTYRGLGNSWICRNEPGRYSEHIRRLLRFVDAHVNISGDQTFSYPSHLPSKVPLINVPGSRFLRPVSEENGWRKKLMLRQLISELEHAAKNGRIYHLWWHPHNFGADVDANISHLREILDHVVRLREQYGLRSLTMDEVAGKIGDASLLSAC